MKRLLGLLALVALLFASRTAAADEPEADQPKSNVKREWYGWQTLATDGVSFAAMGMGLGSLIHEETRTNRTGDNHLTSGLLLGGGFGGYVVGAPTVHAAHGHWGKAGASFAMRTGPLALCGMVAVASSSSDHNGSTTAAGACAVLLFFGTIATVAVDSAVIAREDVAPPPPPSAQISLAPSYDAKTKTGGVSFAAQF